MPILVRPLNLSVDTLSHFSLSGKCPACCCCCSHAFFGWNEYRGAGGCNGAVPMSGMSVFKPCGAQGGARAGL